MLIYFLLRLVYYYHKGVGLPLKSFDRAVERFCYKHPKFGIPRLMLIIVAGQAIMYVLSLIDPSGQLLNLLVFDAQSILQGQIWRLVTFVFFPFYGSVLSTVLSLYFYYFVGTTLEAQWGSGRFTIYYGMAVLLSIIYGFIVQLFGYGELITTHYINLSLFFAFATMWPDFQVLIFFIIPVKMKWLAYIDAFYFVLEMILGRTLLPLIAIANFALFFGYVLWNRLAAKLNFKKRQSDFKRATGNSPIHVNFRKEEKPYRHKCAVCGRTDVSDPNLEFRYCSRCVGYHCFCEDHINSHVHFTE